LHNYYDCYCIINYYYYYYYYYYGMKRIFTLFLEKKQLAISAHRRDSQNMLTCKRVTSVAKACAWNYCGLLYKVPKISVQLL